MKSDGWSLTPPHEAYEESTSCADNSQGQIFMVPGNYDKYRRIWGILVIVIDSNKVEYGKSTYVVLSKLSLPFCFLL